MAFSHGGTLHRRVIMKDNAKRRIMTSKQHIRGWEGDRKKLQSVLTWEDSLIFCSNSPPTRLYFSMHNANDSAAFLDFSSA